MLPLMLTTAEVLSCIYMFDGMAWCKSGIRTPERVALGPWDPGRDPPDSLKVGPGLPKV